MACNYLVPRDVVSPTGKENACGNSKTFKVFDVDRQDQWQQYLVATTYTARARGVSVTMSQSVPDSADSRQLLSGEHFHSPQPSHQGLHYQLPPLPSVTSPMMAASLPNG